MESKNILYIVTGPSGSGKTSTMRKAMNNEIVSFTTRAKREGEVEGVDYIYITEEKFQELMASGDIAESTTYYGTASYGITMTELLGKLERGNAFVIVDVVGKKQLEELLANYPYQTVSIFFSISRETAIERMRLRGDSQENIEKRLKTFDEEINNFYLYDYIVDNEGSKEDTYQAVKYILDLAGGSNVSTEIQD